MQFRLLDWMRRFSFRSFREWLGRFGVIVALLAVIVAFWVLVPHGRFMTTSNWLSILRQGSTLLLIAVGLTIPMQAGDFDLSIAAMASLGAMLLAGCTAFWGFSLPVAIIIVLASGLIVGLANGFLVTRLKVSAIIVTLGIASMLNGIEYRISSGRQIWYGIPTSLVDFARGSIGGFPNVTILAIVIVALLWYIMNHLRIGREILITGGNIEAAKLAGINTDRIKVVAFCIAALVAAIAGITVVGRQAMAFPLSSVGLLLPSFAATFIGATVVKLGEFHVLGTCVGVILMGILTQGLVMLNLPSSTVLIVQGLVLIGALAMATLAKGERVTI